MKILFNGKMLGERHLQRVDSQPSETAGKTDAVAFPGGDETIVLETFETEQAAIDFINSLSDKIKAEMPEGVIDARS